MIGIIGAMEVEMEALKALLEERQDTELGTNVFSTGLLFGREAVLAELRRRFADLTVFATPGGIALRWPAGNGSFSG